MFVRSVSLLMALAFTSLSGCVLEDPASTREPVDDISAAASSYYPMGFARVAADGSVVEQFNSAPGAPTVTHTPGTGSYAVRFPALAGGPNGGHVQITAEGAGNHRCRSMGWSADGAALRVTVQCNLPSGAAADTAFAVLYFRYQQPTAQTNFASAAYAWVIGGASPTAPATYNFNDSGRLNTVQSGGVGVYHVTIPKGVTSNASLMVTAVGGAGAPFCSSGGWGVLGDAIVATVRCWDTSGAPAYGTFTLSYSVTGPALRQQGAHTLFSAGVPSSTRTAAVGRILDCSPAGVDGLATGNLATVVVQGEMGPGDASPFRRAAFVSGFGAFAPVSCKVESRAASSDGDFSTSTSTVRCYDGAGAEAVPVFTFTEVTSDAAGPC